MVKLIAPVVFLGNLGVVFAIWLQTGAQDSLLLAIGRLCGLLAYYLILWQMLLIGRVGWVERPWGHDKVSRVHHIMGILAVSVLFFHPILITLGYDQVVEMGFVDQFLNILTSFEYVIWALTAYIMFLGIIVLSLYIVRKHLRYEYWYFIHMLLYGAIILAFNHQLVNGTDLVNSNAALYWRALFVLAFANIGYYRFFKPVWNFWRHRFIVAEIKPETGDVNSVIITGKNLDALQARAGQFILVRFLTKGLWWEEHPFSLSEMPKGTWLRMSIKAVGDFTKKIPHIPVGTPVIVEGPLGRFITERIKTNSVAMIAGGIGITPLRAMFEELSRAGKQVDLIFSARSQNDFALKNELDTLANATARVHFVPEDTQGRLTPGMINNLIPDVASRDVYLCGPPPMMKAIRKQLQELGVPKNRIYFEKFQLG